MSNLLNTKFRNKKRFWGLLFIIFVGIANIFSQTSGTLTFSVSLAAHSGQYGSEHVVAVWIQNESGAFVKTNLRLAASSHTINKHLNTWKSKSSLNIVDAVSGATLTSYSKPVSISWNATDLLENIVADGTYSINIEESWGEGTAGTSTASFSFVKGPNEVHLTPTATTNFTSITLDWVASSTSTKLEALAMDNFNVFPNPAKSTINLNIKTLSNINSISIKNTLGQTVAFEQVNKAIMGTKLLDVSKLKAGIYYINVDVQNQQKSYSYKVILK